MYIYIERESIYRETGNIYIYIYIYVHIHYKNYITIYSIYRKQ